MRQCRNSTRRPIRTWLEMKPEAADEQLRQRVRSLRLPQQATAGKRLGRWLLRILCLGLAGSTAVLGYLLYLDKTAVSPVPEAPAQSNATTNSRPAQRRLRPAPPASSGAVVLEWTGYIIPAHQILVSPKVNGMVVKLRITESQRVKKGETSGRTRGHGVPRRPRSGEGHAGIGPAESGRTGARLPP